MHSISVYLLRGSRVSTEILQQIDEEWFEVKDLSELESESHNRLGCILLMDSSDLTQRKGLLEKIPELDDARIGSCVIMNDEHSHLVASCIDHGVEDLLSRELAGDQLKKWLKATLEKRRKMMYHKSRSEKLSDNETKLKQTLEELSNLSWDLQRANDRINRFNAELEFQVEMKTETLQATIDQLTETRDELQQSRDELEQAQQQLIKQERFAAMGELSGMISHEIRNPLGALKNSQYLLKRKLDRVGSQLENYRELVELINLMEQDIERATRTVSNLLNFARRKEVELAANKLGDIVKKAIASIEVPVNVELRVELLEDEPELMIDPLQIRMLFANLALNAIQAMMDDGGELMISMKKTEEYLVVTFRDNGPGIPEEVQERIFTPLYSTKVYGTGLGLTIVRQIVDAHHAVVELDSREGEGACFTLHFPLNS